MLMPWTIAKRLRQAGMVGLNQRNSDYIMKYNSRNLYPLVDDKLRTKTIMMQNGIAVPELYARVATDRQARIVPQLLSDYPSVVVKPSRGSGGNGILVLSGRLGNHYQKASGALMSEAAIAHHISNILSGMYSLGGMPDIAFFEYRVQSDPLFDELAYKGVPDIRVIVFKGIPIAAMLRLPTRESDGKANLHKGALGVGIDINEGQTMKGVMHNKACWHHPDTGVDCSGITIPDWPRILELSVKCAQAVKLGYLGVDIVLDAQHGPLVLELNARPGLNVQIATGAGLQKKLDKVEAMHHIPSDIADRITLAQILAKASL